MKRCPRCSQTYTDDALNFCLNDGEFLANFETDPPPTLFGEQQNPFADDAPPTVLLNKPRVTNQTNWQPGSPPAQWQPAEMNAPFSAGTHAKLDQTLPTISLILGIASFVLICCWGGFPLGAAALITGFLGMRNADANPLRYGGRGLAIGGMVLGIVSVIGTLLFVIIAILS